MMCEINRKTRKKEKKMKWFKVQVYVLGEWITVDDYLTEREAAIRVYNLKKEGELVRMIKMLSPYKDI